MEKIEIKHRQRMIGLDLLRVVAALNIFAGHAFIQLKCNYGIFQELISFRAVFMLVFFMLSGFVLYLTYQNKDFFNHNRLKSFYLKRFISIIPVYYFIGFIHLVLINKLSWKRVILLAPIQAFGLQASFDKLFTVPHHGGTWFISCLVVCYFIYPLIQQLILKAKTKTKLIVLIVLCGYLVYIPILRLYFELEDIYSDIIYRCLDFILGILAASFYVSYRAEKQTKQTENKSKHNLIAWFGLISVSLIFIGLLYSKITIFTFPAYNILSYPLVILLLIFAAEIRSKILENSKLLRYLSSISLAFFLVQFFAWGITTRILDQIGKNNNSLKIIISFSVTLVLAMIVHEFFEKPVTKFLKRKLLNQLSL